MGLQAILVGVEAWRKDQRQPDDWVDGPLCAPQTGAMASDLIDAYNEGSLRLLREG
jgi:hypothetical protein